MISLIYGIIIINLNHRYIIEKYQRINVIMLPVLFNHFFYINESIFFEKSSKLIYNSLVFNYD